MKFIKKLLTGLIPALAIIFTLLLTSCSDFANSSDSGSATLTLDGRAIASKLAPLFAEVSETAAADSLVELIVEVHYSYDGKKKMNPFTVLSMTENERAKLEKNATDAERNTYITEKINDYPLVVENLPVGKDVLFGMKVFFSTNGYKDKFAISKERKSVRIGTDTSVSLTLTEYNEKYDWEIAPINLTLKFPSDTNLGNDLDIKKLYFYRNTARGWMYIRENQPSLELDTEKKTATAKFGAEYIYDEDKISIGLICSSYIDGSISYFKGLSAETTVVSGTTDITIELEKANETSITNPPAPDSCIFFKMSRNHESPISEKYLRVTFWDDNGNVIATEDRECHLDKYSGEGFSIDASKFAKIEDNALIHVEAIIYSDSARKSAKYRGSGSFTFYKNTFMEVSVSLASPVKCTLTLNGNSDENLSGKYCKLRLRTNSYEVELNAVVKAGSENEFTIEFTIECVTRELENCKVSIDMFDSESESENSANRKYYCEDQTVYFSVASGSEVTATGYVSLTPNV